MRASGVIYYHKSTVMWYYINSTILSKLLFPIMKLVTNRRTSVSLSPTEKITQRNETIFPSKDTRKRASLLCKVDTTAVRKCVTTTH